MRLVWTGPAMSDRIAIYDRIEADNPRAAAELDEQLASAAERLSRYPEMGRTGRVPGTRELLAHRHYILVYEMDGDIVHILAVAHTSRQWPPGDTP